MRLCISSRSGLPRAETSRLRVTMMAPPTELSSKFLAVGRGHGLSVSKSEDGSWVIFRKTGERHVNHASRLISGDHLRRREESEGDSYPQNLRLRVHRAISWIQRAEMASVDGDPDLAFTCYWIAFNAAYAEDTEHAAESSARALFADYIDRILRLDDDGVIYNAIWSRFSAPVNDLLGNRYVYEPFWKHENGVQGHNDWEERLQRELQAINRARAGQKTDVLLATLFDRLYVLRNQILHGGATWNSSVNRKQVDDGAEIMAFLVPAFVSVMMDHPDEPWGANYYPVVD